MKVSSDKILTIKLNLKETLVFHGVLYQLKHDEKFHLTPAGKNILEELIEKMDARLEEE